MEECRGGGWRSVEGRVEECREGGWRSGLEWRRWIKEGRSDGV